MKIKQLLIVILLSFHCTFVGAQEMLGQWISPLNSSSPNTWIAFRKDININSLPKEAITQIAVDSKYWLWINDELVVFEGGLKRGPTPNDTYYDEVDLAPFFKKGENKIALLVWYFGKEGFSHKSSGKAGLLFNLQSGKLTIASDDSWLCRIHPAYGDTDAPHPNFRLPESNIRFDANKDMAEWTSADNLEELGFETALAFGSWGDAPYNHLIKRPIPQWKDFGFKEFVSTERIKGEQCDTIVAKLPYNLQMTPIIDISAPMGGVIGISTDNTFSAGDVNLRAEYVARQGRQKYESLGWLNGHEVYFVLPKDVTVHSLQYRETGYDTEVESGFTCDDEYINRFWAKALRTLYVNMRDTFFDCPERERAQWWGDVVILMGECFYTSTPSTHALMKKGIKELIDWQRGDGTLFSPMPAGNYDSELPGQMLASVGQYGFWNYYMNTGDRETIAEVYPGVKRYLEVWSFDDKGLTNFRSGGWTWGDWGEHKDIRLILAGWHYLALKGAANMADVLGESADAEHYRSQMTTLKIAYNNCWNGSAYRHSEYNDCTDDRVQALAVISGIAESDKYDSITKTLKSQFYASPYMEKYVMEALFVMDEGSYAIERMKKRFADMVNHPSYTTLFEGWNIGPGGFGGGTVNHAWSGGPLIVIAENVCGIKPLEAGYKTFAIEPDDSYLRQSSICVPTILGKIESKFVSTPEEFKMDITVPKGAQAIVYLPTSDGEEILINGRKAKRRELDVPTIYQSETKQAICLHTGTYNITIKKQ